LLQPPQLRGKVSGIPTVDPAVDGWRPVGHAGQNNHKCAAHEAAPQTMETEMSSVKKSAERLIKKYPNRRLYDTQTSSYITLSDVKQLVLDADDFTVVDAKSSEDLTRAILLQIILEEEANGVPMFSSSVLSQIIRYYGHAMQGMMGSYLEKNVQAFTDIQNKFTSNAAGAIEGKPFSPEMWTQFMNVQGPMMQGMMNNYIDQSKNLFIQMQEQMQSQSKAMFGVFPFPGMTPPPTDKK
jgi:polyhydroxyalkanoate synthesis repressor PhaR